MKKTFFTKENHAQRKEGLRHENWNEVYEQNDPNVVYDLIMTKYAKHYNDAKTVKTCKKGSSRYRREPWMTDEILTDMRKRDRLAKIMNRRSDYQKLRNEIVARTRKARKQYIQKQIKDSMGDIKRHWTVIKQVTNKTNNKDETTTGFYHAGRWVEDNQENAGHFKDFYAKIGSKAQFLVKNPKFF